MTLETRLGIITITILVFAFGFLVYRKVDLHQERLVQASIPPQASSEGQSLPDAAAKSDAPAVTPTTAMTAEGPLTIGAESGPVLSEDLPVFGEPVSAVAATSGRVSASEELPEFGSLPEVNAADSFSSEPSGSTKPIAEFDSGGGGAPGPALAAAAPSGLLSEPFLSVAAAADSGFTADPFGGDAAFSAVAEPDRAGPASDTSVPSDRASADVSFDLHAVPLTAKTEPGGMTVSATTELAENLSPGSEPILIAMAEPKNKTMADDPFFPIAGDRPSAQSAPVGAPEPAFGRLEQESSASASAPGSASIPAQPQVVDFPVTPAFESDAPEPLFGSSESQEGSPFGEGTLQPVEVDRGQTLRPAPRQRVYPAVATTADGKFSLAAFNYQNGAEPPVDDGGKYDIVEVQNGDNYTKISRRVYGTTRYFSALAVFNQHRISDPKRMRPGMKVLTPPANVLDERYPQLFPESHQRAVASAGFLILEDGSPAYRVGERETLSEIAERFLGRSSRWIEIQRLNQSLLPDPNRLKAGIVLALPADAVEVNIAP